MEIITSKTNNKVKNIINLINKKHERIKQGQFVVEGIKIFRELVKNKIKIKMIFVTEEFLDIYREELRCVLDKEVSCIIITEDICKKISNNVTPQEMFSICEIPSQPVIEDILDNGKNILMLLGLQDIGNFGTIIRTASALGVDSVLISQNCPDLYNHKVLRATMGAIFNVDIVRVENPIDVINKLKNKGFKSYASTVSDNSQNLNQVSFTNKNVIIVGNEGNGLDSEILKVCDEAIKIPMVEKIDSLNVAVATGILLWELKSKNIIN